MRSASTPHAAPKTAARIREAAIALFAERGFARATVRSIAEAAEVSPGLVIHHFGSKEGLREACDEHVFDALTEAKRQDVRGAAPLAVGLFQDPTSLSYIFYLTRSLLDPTGQGQRFFDHYVETIEEILQTGFEGYEFRVAEDRRAQATALAMVALGPVLLEDRIRHCLQTNDFTGSMKRLIPVLTDLYTHGFISHVPHEAEPQTAGENPGSPHDPPR